MSEMKFTEDHVWVRLEDDGTATIGITDYAQEQLGDIVFVEFPPVEKELGMGDEAAIIESVKTAGEVKMPISGTVIETNDSLVDEPEVINADPEGDGWLMTVNIINPDELETLMDDSAYNEFLSGI
ncbi:MAG: glycine cleavage system H protein [Gammaproteobacteria bacterium]|jgi:glycine cleavage system H protein